MAYRKNDIMRRCGEGALTKEKCTAVECVCITDKSTAASLILQLRASSFGRFGFQHVNQMKGIFIHEKR